jgi:hypothetical protein
MKHPAPKIERIRLQLEGLEERQREREKRRAIRNTKYAPRKAQKGRG